MAQKKINLRKELVGKVLYKNGRRYLEIWEAHRIPKSWWIFLTGYKLTDKADPYFVLTELALREGMASCGRYRFYWNGDVIEFKENKRKEK